MLKAILFDLDDTLIDWSAFELGWEASEAPHIQQVFDYLCRDLYPLADFGDFLQEYFRRTRAAWGDARNTLRAPNLGQILVESAQACGVPRGLLDIQACLRAYDWRAPASTFAFPDVPDALALLRRHGLRLGIVTNAFQPMWLRDIEIRTHGLMDFFPDCRFSAADVGYLKPHPVIFQTALACLGVSASETVFVGDNPVADVAGAQGVGIRGVLRVKQPRQPLISGLVVPDGAVNTLTELPHLLDTWFAGWR